MKNFVIGFVVFTFTFYNISAQNTTENYLYKIGSKDSIYSEVLREQRDVWVHFPDGRNINPNLKYPVVYILDGSVQMSALATVYENYWGNYLPKMILVGISNQTNRTRDLTTSKIENPNME